MKINLVSILLLLTAGCSLERNIKPSTSRIMVQSMAMARIPATQEGSATTSAQTMLPAARLWSWLNGNTGNSNVITGLVSSHDLLLPMNQWTIRVETNCDEVTNYAMLPCTQGVEFMRAFNR